MRIALLALVALTANAIEQKSAYEVVNNNIYADGCPLPLAHTQK